jgi:catechol 2,3-dioxygenase-like lactoylglutathione lyase family enzyme
MAPGEQKSAAVIGHVGIEVTSINKSKKFYKTLLEALGFKVIMDTKEGFGFSNGNLALWISEVPESRVKRKAPTGEEFVIADHLAFLVRSREVVYGIEREMNRKGFEALFPCEEHPEFEPGYHAVSFCDPDNYVIEVYTRSKTS